MGTTPSPLGEYLRARREILQPEDVGLPRDSSRRVPGLRREEVAARADISPEYYLRIEQGRDRRPSEQVVRSLAKALMLDDNGASYLFRLARPLPYMHSVHPRATVSESVTRLLDKWTQTPAYVTDSTLDVLASNRMARLVSPGILVPGTNLLEAVYDRYTMSTTMRGELDEDQWERTFREHIGALRFAGDPLDPRLQDVVGRLSMRHLSFRRIWAEHDVTRLTSGIRHAVIEPFGQVALNWQTLGISRSPGQFLTTYMAEPGSPGAKALAALSESRDPVAAPSGREVASGRLEPPLVFGRCDGEARDERAS